MFSLVSLSSIRLLHWLPGASAMISVARADRDTCARTRIYAISVRKCEHANVEATIEGSSPPPVQRVEHRLPKFPSTSKAGDSVIEPRKPAIVWTGIRVSHAQHPPQVPSESTVSAFVWLALSMLAARPKYRRYRWCGGSGYMKTNTTGVQWQSEPC